MLSASQYGRQAFRAVHSACNTLMMLVLLSCTGACNAAAAVAKAAVCVCVPLTIVVPVQLLKTLGNGTLHRPSLSLLAAPGPL